MLSAAGSRRARSLPPSTFSSGTSYLPTMPRSTRFGPLRSALGRTSKENSIPSLSRGRKTQRYQLGNSRRSNGLHKMDALGKKRIPDYTDIAYREAVSRLRYLLAESYTSPHRSYLQGYRSGDEEGDSVIERTRALLSPYRRPVYSRRTLFPTRSPSRVVHSEPIPDEVQTAPTTPRAATVAPTTEQSPGTLPPEMMSYIERQEEYIEQLERESQFCREELSGLLTKVKEVISENEGLQEKQKSNVMRSVLDYLQPSDEDDEEGDTETSEVEPRGRKNKSHPRRRMEGPSIVFESRISELEAQLTQVRVELKKAQDEADEYKRRLLGEGLLGDSCADSEPLRHQLENLKREKAELAETVAKLQATAAQLRDRESDTAHRFKRTQEAVEQAQFERSQSELEVRRLKDELERLHGRLREAVAEQGRRVADERAGVERRYQHQAEQLQSELSSQWDAAGRLQLELDKQKRVEAELRRELANKNATIDDMAKETQAKIDVLQGQLHAALAQQSTLGQELNSAQLQVERADRQSKQDCRRLEAEIEALRERLERADAETLRARQEALRLSEQLAALDREMTLKQTKDSSDAGPRESELLAMISSMQEKHVETVAELEGMIESQNQVMAKLKDECHILTERLEDTSARHKNEMAQLQNNVDYLNSKLDASFDGAQNRDVEFDGLGERYNTEPTTNRNPTYSTIIPDTEGRGQYESAKPGYAGDATRPSASAARNAGESRPPSDFATYQQSARTAPRDQLQAPAYQSDVTESTARGRDQFQTPAYQSDIADPTRTRDQFQTPSYKSDITEPSARGREQFQAPTYQSEVTESSARARDQFQAPTYQSDVTESSARARDQFQTPTYQSDVTESSARARDQFQAPAYQSDVTESSARARAPTYQSDVADYTSYQAEPKPQEPMDTASTRRGEYSYEPPKRTPSRDALLREDSTKTRSYEPELEYEHKQPPQRSPSRDALVREDSTKTRSYEPESEYDYKQPQRPPSRDASLREDASRTTYEPTEDMEYDARYQQPQRTLSRDKLRDDKPRTTEPEPTYAPRPDTYNDKKESPSRDDKSRVEPSYDTTQSPSRSSYQAKSDRPPSAGSRTSPSSTRGRGQEVRKQP